MPLLRETTITMSSSNNFGTEEFQELCSTKNEKNTKPSGNCQFFDILKAQNR